jgi:hypothetical protein
MADATDLKSVDRKVVRVRLPPSAPLKSQYGLDNGLVILPLLPQLQQEGFEARILTQIV